MESISDVLSALVSAFKKFLGIQSPELKRIKQMEQKLAAAKTKNIDKMEDYKDKVRQLEAQARRKKTEYESVRGDSKRVIGSEIERLFRELDRMRGQETIIASNLERISVTQTKLEEYRLAIEKGLEESDLDDLALDLKDAFESLQVADRTTRDLERTNYQTPEYSPVNAERRMEEVAGEKETETGLSANIEKRLMDLETE